MVNVKIIERTEIEREDDSGADDEQHERDGEHDIENDRQRGFLKFIRHGKYLRIFYLAKADPHGVFCGDMPSGMGFSNFFVETNVIRCPSFFEFIGNMVAQSLQNRKENAQKDYLITRYWPKRCPFGVKQMTRMTEIKDCFDECV